MSKSSLLLKSACLAAMLCVPNCRPDDAPPGSSQGGAGGTVASGGTTSAGGSTSTGG